LDLEGSKRKETEISMRAVLDKDAKRNKCIGGKLGTTHTLVFICLEIVLREMIPQLLVWTYHHNQASRYAMMIQFIIAKNYYCMFSSAPSFSISHAPTGA
jgi:hypothetical protein